MTYIGKIKNIINNRGFGFIKSDDIKDDVFFHRSELEKNVIFEELNRGDLVEFELTKTHKGLQAINIKKLARASKSHKTKRSAKSVKPTKKHKTKNKKKEKKEKFAKAPYNFVPLNNDVMEGQMRTPSIKFDKDRQSGFIDCKLETLTPLFIGDGNEAEGEKNVLSFFEPTGIPIIPGSSLRGMIRSIMEIVTFGKFVNFDNKTLYYRTFADNSNKMKTMYTDQMSDQENEKSITLGGYLRKKGLKYFIQPAQTDEDGKTYKNISHDDLLEKLRIKKTKFSELEKEKALKKLKFQHFEVGSAEKLGGYYVISGPMGLKLSERHVFRPDESKQPIQIPQKDIEDYRKDKNRSIDSDLLERLDKDRNKVGIPCFYIQWVDEDAIDENTKDRVSFGHTALFRKAYQRSIGKAVPQNLKNKSLIDFTESIFGISKSNDPEKEMKGFSGRVAFSDAQPISKIKFQSVAKLKTLSTPKPTSIQLYLEQNRENYDIHKLNTYNDKEAVIRGYKHYWHKSGNNWEKPSKEKFRKKLDKSIAPIEKGANFKFRIWFDNLTEIELGSLMFCLNLDENLGLKLGMGRPVGLGSVKITSTLNIINRETRYTKLFDLENGTWYLQIIKKSNKDVTDLIKSFEEYILGNLSHDDKSNEIDSVWDLPRLQKLRLLLDIEQGKKLENKGKIDYMDLKEFRKRNRLPHPDEI